jgi:hypothetical protein
VIRKEEIEAECFHHNDAVLFHLPVFGYIWGSLTGYSATAIHVRKDSTGTENPNMINLISVSFTRKEKIIMPASEPNINIKRANKKILRPL